MSWIISHIGDQKNKNAIIFDHKTFSYNDLFEKIHSYYEDIIKLIPTGSTVAIVSDYNFESIALFFALYKNKNILVPITSKIENEIQDRINISSCNFSVYIKNKDLCINEIPTSEITHTLILDLIKKSKAGLILFSSGSTGTPKAMVHNLDNLIDSCKNKRSKKFVFLIFLMFDHIGGLNTMLNCISMSVTMVFPTDRNPDHVCSLIEKYKVNILPASPTFLNLIFISQSQAKYDLSSLKMITYGTEPMPENLLLKIKDIFPKTKFLQTFGTSETGISKTSSKSSSSTFLKLDDPNIEHKIVNNELWLRSRTQILGYLNSSMEQFTEDGWFKTGDLIEKSDDGYIKILGRGTELINIGGEKVLPSEIESILFQMPEVNDCIVYGEANPIIGQIVVAKIFFNKKMTTSEAKNIVRVFCIKKLDRYKIPAKVILMSESEYSDRFKKKRIL